MTALLYFVVAVVAASIATRAWLSARSEPSRRSFLMLGWAVAIAYASFALSLLPGLHGLRLLYMFAGQCVPALLVWTIDRVFRDEHRPVRPTVLGLGAITLIVAPITTGVHAGWFRDVNGASPPEVVAGLFGFFALGLALVRLWRAHERTTLEVERTRLRYFFGVVAIAVGSTAIEHIARLSGPTVDMQGLSLASRGVALQGAIPPFSVVFSGVALYLLFHIVNSYRLLDLQELLARLSALLISASMLVLVDALTLAWVDAFTTYPVHGAFQLFLASLVFLAAWDPLRGQVQWLANRLINQRGQRLSDTLDSLQATLPGVISKDALTDVLLKRLSASGRVAAGSVYLWDAKLDAYLLAGARGHGESYPLKAVAARPFTDGFISGTPFYVRSTLEREARTDAEAGERLRLLNAMSADLSMPFISGGVVLGWVHLRDEDWSDGYSAEEIIHLQRVAALASIVLSNIAEFQALEEEHRLATLGTMAAGLAHEIRNPLAGIKGAAQYLQAERLADEAHEMLQVVVTEADRLNRVVSQFLDYARPFELSPTRQPLNAVVTHVVALLHAQGLPENITLIEDLAGDLPDLPLDDAPLSQVLLNLLRNGLEAMPTGGTLRVSTRRRPEAPGGANTVELVVHDEGVGIHPDDLPNIFIPFYTSKRQGTGLGLAICQRIITAHGGELDVQSQLGHGATFSVRLPISVELPPTITGPQPTEPQSAQLTPIARPRLPSWGAIRRARR